MMRHFGTTEGGFVYFGTSVRVGYSNEPGGLVVHAGGFPGWQEPTAAQRDEARRFLAGRYACPVMLELRTNDATPTPPRFTPGDEF